MLVYLISVSKIDLRFRDPQSLQEGPLLPIWIKFNPSIDK